MEIRIKIVENGFLVYYYRKIKDNNINDSSIALLFNIVIPIEEKTLIAKDTAECLKFLQALLLEMELTIKSGG